MYDSLEVDEYKAQYQDTQTPHLLLDVRTPEEYSEGRIAGAVLIPLDELPERTAEVPRDLPVVVVCRSGMRSLMAIYELRRVGFTNTLINLEGGTSEWAQNRLPLESD